MSAATSSSPAPGTPEAVPAMLVDQPDGSRRVAKAVWRQVRDEVAQAVRAGLAADDVDGARVSLLGGDEVLAAAVGQRAGVDVHVRELPVDGPVGTGDHVVVVLVPAPASSATRIDVIQQSLHRVRAAGHLVVLATVVTDPTVPGSRRPPAITGLFEEITLATGGDVHLDDLRSIRWDREPVRRGVVLSLTALTRPRGW